MKTRLILVMLLSVAVARTFAAASGEDEYGRLLKKYVTPDGVRYAAWKKDAADVAALQRVVDGVASAPVSKAKSKEQLAFHLNAYNAWILHEALAKYPTKSVKDTLFTFFLASRLTVAGEKMSFNHLEKDIIRPRFGEPRVHFALNCASRSCPPLLAEPWSADKLDAQLERQTKGYVNGDKGVLITKKGVALSKIFDWYKEDFGGTPKVISFINKRRANPLPANAQITYQEYNWNLNETK